MPRIVSLPAPVADLVTGDSSRISAGTGKSGPAGIEAVLEYNGTYFNVRSWLDTFIITSIAGIDDADIRDSRDLNPGAHGETPFAAYYGGRTIVLTGRIRAHTLEKLRDMQLGLRQTFADITEEKPLIFRTGDPLSDLMIFCKKSQAIVMSEEQQSGTLYTRDFQVTLRASNPRFITLNERISSKAWGTLDAFDTSAIVSMLNFARNPGGENTTTSWSVSGGASVATLGNSGSVVRTGLSSISVTKATSTGDMTVQQTMDLASDGIVPGDTMSLSAYFRALSAARSCAVSIAWYNGVPGGGGSLISTDTSSNVTDSTISWNRVTLDGKTVPATCTHALISMIVRAAAVSEAHYFDDVTFVKSPTSPVAFTGDSPNGRWSGGRHTTTSELLSALGTEANWTFDKSNGQASTKGGYLMLSTPIAEVWLNSKTAPISSDRAITLNFFTGTTVASITNGRFGIRAKRTAADTFLAGLVNVTGASAVLELWGWTAGTGASIVASGTFSLVASTHYWMKLTMSGNVVTLAIYTADPNVGTPSPVQSVSTTLSAGNATAYGAGVTGGDGIYLYGVANDWKIDDFRTSPAAFSSVAFTTENSGNFPAQPVFRVYGPLSAATNGGPAADILVGDQQLSLNAKAGTTVAIAQGNYIEINTANRTMKEYTSAGAFISNSFSQLDITSDWVELAAGPVQVNMVTYAIGSPTLEMRHRDTVI